MSATFKAALQRPIHQQIADFSDRLINLVGEDVTFQAISYNQGIIYGLRLALASQEDVFKKSGYDV